MIYVFCVGVIVVFRDLGGTRVGFMMYLERSFFENVYRGEGVILLFVLEYRSYNFDF